MTNPPARPQNSDPSPDALRGIPRPLSSLLFWVAGLLASIAAIICLQHTFGGKFEYPTPRFASLPGLVFLVFTLCVTLLIGRGKHSRWTIPWIALSFVAGTCFYPFLCCGQSFVTTNFLSANWAYPFSQIQPPAKLVNPEPHDSFMMYFPYKFFWAKSILENFSFPFWDPTRNAGMPFVAATLTGAFYPLNVFFLAGSETGWGIVGLAHLLVSGVGMFLLVEKLSKCRFAALYAGVAFMLMPMLAGWSRGVAWNSTGVWLPLICYFLLEAITGRSLRSAGHAAVVLAVSNLGGWVQWSIYIHLLIGMFVAQHILINIRVARWTAVKSACLIGLAVIVLGTSLSIIHLGPFSEVTGLQPRTTVPWKDVVSYHFPYGSAANFAYFIPSLFGNYVDGVVAPNWSLLEYQRYLGIFCLPLALLALARKDTALKTLFIAPAFLFFLSVSQLGIGYKFLYVLVPGFDAIPTQQIRALFIVEFLVLLVSALGASNLIEHIKRRPHLIATSLLSLACIYLLLALVIFRQALGLVLPELIRDASGSRAVAMAIFFAATGLVIAITPRTLLSGKRTALALQGFVLLASGGELIVEQCKSASFSRPLVTSTPPIVSEIRSSGNGRIFRAGGLPPTYAFIQNSAALIYGINDTMAHDSIYLSNYAKFYSLFNPQSDYTNPHALVPPKVINRENSELVRMLNVDYIFHRESTADVTEHSIEYDHGLLDRIRFDDGRHIFRLKDPLPRAFFVQQVEYRAEGEVMKRLVTPGFRATDTAFLDSLIQSGTRTAFTPDLAIDHSPVSYVQHSPNSFSLRYTSKVTRPIFISNVMYPGWKARAQPGAGIPIFQANLAFMLVFAPPSEAGEILFTFRPTHFGLYMTVLVFACVALVITQLRPNLLARGESLAS